nr:MAG TPA: hypothetical protein [Caudoviricetes sp.]
MINWIINIVSIIIYPYIEYHTKMILLFRLKKLYQNL